MAKKQISLKPGIIIFAIIFSILLYLAGLYSGLNAHKVTKNVVEEDISLLREYMDLSALDLKNIQLQQLFLDKFSNEDSCKFSSLYMDQLYDQLNSYWTILPSRLEAYEKNNEPTDEYITLKREYIRFSLRFWVIAQDHHQNCKDSEYLPILYFYTKDCKNCINQGIEFDKFNEDMIELNKTALVFPIDLAFPDDTVQLLARYYNISETPALILNDRVFQGTVINSELLSDFFVKP